MFLEWLALAGLGFLLAYFMFRWENYNRMRNEVNEKTKTVGIEQVREEAFWAKSYRALSWRKESRLIGTIATAKVPSLFRKPVFHAYIKAFKVDMTDVHEQDLAKYTSLNEFFSRRLKEGARPIDKNCLVSPADCHVHHFGEVTDCVVREVKGFNYNLHAFLGDDIAEKLCDQLKKKHSRLWYCVCYLSPSDYHRFHSPADWTITFRRHFSGRLLSVSDKVVNNVAGLFDVNERVVVVGDWKHGFFSMTSVGATNVGAIQHEFDGDHRTNEKLYTVGTFGDRTFDPPVRMNKGDTYGRFLFGSTLVCIFQAPDAFKFIIEKGDKLNYGQAIGDDT